GHDVPAGRDFQRPGRHRVQFGVRQVQRGTAGGRPKVDEPVRARGADDDLVRPGLDGPGCPPKVNLVGEERVDRPAQVHRGAGGGGEAEGAAGGGRAGERDVGLARGGDRVGGADVDAVDVAAGTASRAGDGDVAVVGGDAGAVGADVHALAVVG